ncbi:MAG: PaaI family thioesterase [Myxococcota bacterium]|nr:PaaI family thioesterase [Myxococcota bacterium]
MSLDYWRKRFEQTPYVRRLGCEVNEIESDRVRLSLPYLELNTNPGRALHGGVNASMIAFAGSLAAETGLDASADLEAGVIDLSVVYLAAAIGEDIHAEGRVLRRGREIVFCEASVTNDQGRELARGLVTYRSVPRAQAERAAAEDPDPARIELESFIEGEMDPGAMGRALGRAPFIGSLMEVEHMGAGRARLAMDPAAEVLDAEGSHHAGALAALLDTAGALGSWSLVPLGAHKAMTPGIQISYAAPSKGERVVALSRNLRKHAEAFSNRVDLVGEKTGRLIAQGLLSYRIVVGEKLPDPKG